MKNFYSTRQVALTILKVKPDTLQKAIWQGRVNPPSKSPSGQYLWTVRDVEGAAWALGRYDELRAWNEKIKPGDKHDTQI